MAISKCDKCAELITDIDAGFLPGMHEMGHLGCGGTWRIFEGALLSDRAINRSITHNEIVNVEWTQDLQDEFDARSDNSVRYRGEYDAEILEYWGTDENGDDWRVHLVRR